MDFPLGQIAGIVSFLAFFPYVYFTIKEGKKPNRATWFIWMIVGFVLLGSYYYGGGERGAIWVPISYTLGPTIVFIVSIWYGEGGWTKFDRWCVLTALVSLPLVFIYPLVTLGVALFIDFLGALPTIRHVYHKPEDESRIAWIMFFVANTLNMLGVQNWALVEGAYTVYMVCGSGVITFLVVKPRKVFATAK